MNRRKIIEFLKDCMGFSVREISMYTGLSLDILHLKGNKWSRRSTNGINSLLNHLSKLQEDWDEHGHVEEIQGHIHPDEWLGYCDGVDNNKQAE